MAFGGEGIIVFVYLEKKAQFDNKSCINWPRSFDSLTSYVPVCSWMTLDYSTKLPLTWRCQRIPNKDYPSDFRKWLNDTPFWSLLQWL